MRVVSLFSGAGGLDLGLTLAGHEIVAHCENYAPAARVLERHFDAPIYGDVADLSPDVLPEYDILTAGFPCTNLSPAGKKQGIYGKHSGLVSHVFRILAETQPPYLILENSPNVLQKESLRYISETLLSLGYDFAFRTVDTRSFGLPQRRERTFFIASNVYHPKDSLLGYSQDISFNDSSSIADGEWYGFMWSAGGSGKGWARESTPTITSSTGSSNAAIWIPSTHELLVPGETDGEALQGFPPQWTAGESKAARWTLIGNAVSVPIGHWLGEVVGEAVEVESPRVARRGVIRAGHSDGDRVVATDGNFYPFIPDFSGFSFSSLSVPSSRSMCGFLARINESGITLIPEFRRDLEAFCGR